jgi:hypothetical protein
MNSRVCLLFFLILGLLLPNCTAAPAAPTESSSHDLPALVLAPNQAVYEFVGRWDAEARVLSIEPLASSDPKGLAPKGFGVIANGNVGYATGANVLGPKTAAEYPPDGCPANNVCAMVTTTNLSSQTMESLYTEVSSITSGFGVSNSDSVPPGYSPPLYTGIGVWNSGTVAPGAGATKDWHFSLGSGNFTFSIRALATFTRTSYSFVGPTAATFVDACTLSGHGELAGTGSVQLPFATSIYGVTATVATVGVDGIMGIGNIGSTTNNNGGFAGANAWNSSIAPFWDKIVLGSSSKLCYATTGASETRQFIVTWSHVLQGGSLNDVSFSVAIDEKTDDFTLYYGVLNGGGGGHGAGASIGVRGATSAEVTAVWDNSTGSAPLSSNSKIVFTASPGNPAAK